MFKQGIVAIAAVVSFQSGAAIAKETPQPTATDAAAPAKSKPRYCFNTEAQTGSIQRGRVCKTADQWRAEGVDVANPQARN